MVLPPAASPSFGGACDFLGAFQALGIRADTSAICEGFMDEQRMLQDEA